MARLRTLLLTGRLGTFLKYFWKHALIHLRAILIQLEDKLSWFNYAKWLGMIRPVSRISERVFNPAFLIIHGHGCHLVEHTLKALRKFDLDEKCFITAINTSFIEIKSSIAKLIDKGCDYLCFCDAGDWFDDDYLQTLASTCQGSKPLIIYSDSDRSKVPQQSSDRPFLKPDASFALLLSINYLRHAFYHKDLVHQFIEEASSLEEFFSLMVFEALKGPDRVIHVPGVMVHTAHSEMQQFPSSFADQIPAGLALYGLGGIHTSKTKEGHLHVTWNFPKPLVSLIIPTSNKVEVLDRMLSSLFAITDYPQYEVVLVDNDSKKEVVEDLYIRLSKDARVKILLRKEPFNYSLYNNLGAHAATGETLIFLNNDMLMNDPVWLSELVMWATLPQVGVVGGRLMYPNGRIQHAGVVLGLVGTAGHIFRGEKPQHFGPFGSPMWYRNYLAVTGACMAIQRDVFDVLGGFDEGYQLAFSDIALCLKAIEMGYQVIYNPYASMIHYEGKTRKRFTPESDIKKMSKEFEPWILKGDYLFNPFLSHSITKPTFLRCYEDNPDQKLRTISELAEI